jgi:hypothetical protein
MALPIIQSLWVGGQLSLIEQLSISSFLKNNHEFHLYTYGDVENIPEGTVVKDANEILDKKNIFTYCNGSYAGFADWFRWELLYKKGGFWVDTDMICLKPFDFDTDLIFGSESRQLVCPAVLGFPPKHDFCKFIKDSCENPNAILPYDRTKTKKKKLKRKLLGKGRESMEWGETGGPEGFTKALDYFGIREHAKPFVYFYPIHFDNWFTVYDDTFKKGIQLFADTYAIHLWNEMSRREKFDKNATFHKDSLIEQLKRKYL